MGAQLHVMVPDDLWQYLDAADFDSVDSFRGADQWADAAHAVVAVADGGLGMGANLVTVILGRDAIASFLEQVERWIGRRRGAEGAAGAAAVSLTLRTGDGETTVAITSTGTAEVDAETLARLLNSAMNGDQGRGQAG
ncbi:hypothetical protein [Actinacidiphila glaucinigra]|uniref:hypothetical protein n=1 Tax=Actinacidiphila glaucinigra TaxID=235986 RepID=UPI0029B27856|nr:hypothetical protein [Streptomyces sp. PA03-3a]